MKRDNEFQIMQADKPLTPNSAPLDQDGSDLTYFVKAQIGAEKQDMWMLLDTGGSYTWVFGSDCTSKACEQHNTFEGDDDDEISNTKWRVGYGTGTVNGTLAADVISVAETAIAVNMTFGLATGASEDFLSYQMDGILGLAPSTSGKTFMDRVQEADLLESNVVGFSISRAADGAKDGEVTFGGVDESKFSGSISYTDTVTEGDHSRLWSIPLDDASVDGKACHLSGRTAIVDTGTSYIMAPQDDARTLHDNIPGASPKDDNSYIVPCDSQANVQLVFSGNSYSISPQDYIGRPESGNLCASTIVGQETFGDTDWLVGDAFLKNVYTVFDYDERKIGFAPRGNVSALSNSSTATSTIGPSTTLLKSPSSPPTLKPTSTRGSRSDSAASSAASTTTASAGRIVTGPGMMAMAGSMLAMFIYST